MLGMISLLAAVVVRYSNSYSDGDDRHRFLGWLVATIAAVEVLVLAGKLGLLVVAWVATSAWLHRLLVFYPDRRRAVVAARKKFVAARVGDGFLVTAPQPCFTTGWTPATSARSSTAPSAPSSSVRCMGRISSVR